MAKNLSEMGATLHPDGVLFRVWAPNAKVVYVTGTFNNWANKKNPLSKDNSGVWSGIIENAKPGDEYKYVIITENKELLKNDPYSKNVTSSVGNSIIFNPDFNWGEDKFQCPDFNRLVIYELHLGTFGKTQKDLPGSIDGAISRLSYLKELGVNAIEIMPMMEFPGGWSWGYNPSYIFAIESDYGEPNTFKHFVKVAHELGIAVILDVVYNHFGPSDLDLWQFDGWSQNNKGGIYFYNDWRSKTPWGDSRPDYGRPEVFKYIFDNVLMWAEEYHIDGLRWDATAYIRNAYGNDGDSGSDIPEGWHLMQKINEELKLRKSNFITIAEDLRGNSFITREAKDGGAGFSAQWDAKFVHPIRKAIIQHDDSSRNMDAVRNAILHRYYLNAFERILYTESHDEVANGKARVPEEIAHGNAATWEAKKRSILGAVLVFTSPGIPMIFQGQEFLEDDWFHDTDPIDWTKKEKYSGILKLYCDLIQLRLNLAGFTEGLSGQEVSVYYINHNEKIIAYHRWSKGGQGDSVIIVLNMANKVQKDLQLGFPNNGIWKVRLNTDSQIYDAEFSNIGESEIITDQGEKDGSPATCNINIGPYSAIILSQDV